MFETNVCRPESGKSHVKRRHRKKALKPAIKRELVSYLTAQFARSLRQACRTLSLSRTVYFYQPNTGREEPVIHALTELAERYNNERPHESLNNLTPEEYRLMAEKPEISKNAWN